eukprot:CAMPEP_0197543916 /NCGR_PEP_ID=MMETSP1318-20131121/68496_1 /TAXON_ID=552666 /ORGANISM="Partenskyella glossopodia, Strain RCC365" /LENGTH=315 /DNA_ID=CAMNT_0043103285 /DNA_START=144 /DNA_END=1091 /DNA_ORIENTATION=+
MGDKPIVIALATLTAVAASIPAGGGFTKGLVNKVGSSSTCRSSSSKSGSSRNKPAQPGRLMYDSAHGVEYTTEHATEHATEYASIGGRPLAFGARQRKRRELLGKGITALGLWSFALMKPTFSHAKVTYGEDITQPNLDRDFTADETVQADMAWEQYRTKTKGGLAQPPPTKPALSPSRYLAIIYALKEESFDSLKGYLKRAVMKETVSGMQAEFRRMDVALLQDAFDEMRQAMYYLPSAVAQKNSALGYNLERRYNVVLSNLENLDQELNFLSYGRSGVTDDDFMAVKTSIKDLEASTSAYIEYATDVVAMLKA